MSMVSQVTPSPFDLRTPTDRHKPIEPKLGFAEIVATASDDGRRRGWDEPVGGVFYSPRLRRLSA